MEELAEGIYRANGFVNAYLVDGDQGVVLVDTGPRKRGGPLAEGLKSIGRAPMDIVAILLTHSHPDHTSGAAYFKKTSGAAVIASPGDRAAIEGDEPMAPPPIFPAWLGWVTRIMPSATAVDVDIAVEEADQGELPDDFGVVDTPGHTPGHISYLLDRKGGVAFVGDAAAADKDGSVVRGFMNGNGNPSVDDSIARLGEHDFRMALFGHSGPIRSGASQAFRAFSP
jgi:glyoxylase-like metal-dependent hydrolase (beta-lactamase superfamily II)